MRSYGRMIALGAVSLAVGFVGGAWFITSGAAFQLIGERRLPIVEEVRPTRPRVAPKVPHVKAVAVPPWGGFPQGSGGLAPAVERVDLLPSPGCRWAIEPRAFRIPGSWQWTEQDHALGGYAAIDAAGGRLRYLLIQFARTGQLLALRPVFFDAQGNRHVPQGGNRGKSSRSGTVFQMSELFLDPLDPIAPSDIAYFGIEHVVPDAAKRLVAAAQQQAKARQVAILPPPELGQPYGLDLPTVDDARVRLADLKGKAVLVAVWGPGSSGLGLMNERDIRKACTKDELAIVNISFDGSAQDARETLAQGKCEGPLVVVPNDAEVRRIWREGGGITRLPAYFLIDREGILRFTCGMFDLPEKVHTLLGRPSRWPMPRPAVVHRIIHTRPDPPRPVTERPPLPTQMPSPVGAYRPGP